MCAAVPIRSTPMLNPVPPEVPLLSSVPFELEMIFLYELSRYGELMTMTPFAIENHVLKTPTELYGAELGFDTGDTRPHR